MCSKRLEKLEADYMRLSTILAQVCVCDGHAVWSLGAWRILLSLSVWRNSLWRLSLWGGTAVSQPVTELCLGLWG